MKIYDCFQFFNELDLLELRLELLYDHVDYFVISETNRTHSDLEKPLFFLENKEKYEKYLDKIIYVNHEFPQDILNMGRKEGGNLYTNQYNKISERYDIEENEGQLKKYPTFCRDYLQKEFIKFGLVDCDDDDLIMISDLDEFPDPKYIDEVRIKNLNNVVFMQDCFYYNINTLAHTNWYGNYVVRYSDTKDVSLTHLKNKRVNFEKLFKAGWHFSFMGGPERVKTKIKSYAHQEYNNPSILNSVEQKINSGVDVFNRPSYQDPLQEFYFDKMINVDIEQFPTKMIELIKQKYNYLIR
jgi:beta-1,4-mannosyl-glycoprotein beta-1,4-N-acetylglucosaminyltransferase